MASQNSPPIPNEKTISLPFPPYSLTHSEYQHMLATNPNLQIKNSVHAIYSGQEDPPGTGVWVHEHVTDEVDAKLMTLPFGVDNKTICKNLETVGAVYYPHWDMSPSYKEWRRQKGGEKPKL